jgi:hypothetical protein
MYMPASTNSNQHNMCLAYELAMHVAVKLQLETEPLKRLPLAICQKGANSCQPMYAFPSVISGKWLLFQRATEASMFIALWLSRNHTNLLTEEQWLSLKTSSQFAQTLLRCLRPSLPNAKILQEMHTKCCHKHLALTDGWIDTTTLLFKPLPYLQEHMVFQHALPFCYKQLMGVEPSQMEQALDVLSDYFPVQQERDWLIRYLGRCLSKNDGSKVLICLTDSLGNAPGNSAKSTVLSWLQSALGTDSCTLSSGQSLTVGHAMAHAVSSDTAYMHRPLIQCFDEISRTNGKTTSAQQINYGQLKFLTSGRRNQPATIIAANVGDWPDLLELQEFDLSFTNRLIMLPARSRFNSTDCTNIQDKLDSLAPALARILMDAYLEYKQANNQLLPVPESMRSFKQLVIRSSSLQNYATDEIKFTQHWLTQNVLHDDSRNLPIHTLQQLFHFHWQSNFLSGSKNHKKQITPAQLQQLLDAALATRGIPISSNQQQYEGIWLAGLQ